ncbi:MAG: hypothetical protein CMK59_14535 [Proteobacteria bacterium]|nr:hypothetical protein [Pseudomonadota bacterium]
MKKKHYAQRPHRKRSTKRRTAQHLHPSEEIKIRRSRSSNPQLTDLFQIRKSNRKSDREMRPLADARIKLLGTIVSCCFAVLILRAGQLMLIPNDKLENQAVIQFERTEIIEGRRGNILDRNHELLATSVMLWNMTFDPSLLRSQDVEALVDHLGLFLPVDTDRLKRRISKAKANKSRWLIVRQKDSLSPLRLDPHDKERVEQTLSRLYKKHRSEGDRGFYRSKQSISFSEASYRFYPNRADAAPLLGIVMRSGAGASGLEQAHDSMLRGERISHISLRDRKNNTLSELELENQLPQARDGNNLVLSIDRNLQHIADQATQRALETTGAQGAWSMVMNVKTGDILAVSSQPTSNINNLQTIKENHLLNRGLTSIYEPGSVIKPLVAAIAIDEGLYSSSTLINCEGGSWYTSGKRIRDDHPQKIISLSQVIEQSSNIGIAKVAIKLGPELMLSRLRELGFGKRPPIDFPGIPSGILRSAERIKPIEMITTAYGYGMSASMVQILSSFAALGNDGVLMRPRLIKEVLTPEGATLTSYEPEDLGQIFQEETAKATVQMLKKVVTKGTGRNASVPGYTTGGKTGTAKKFVDGSYSPTDRIGSFFGLIPADDPILAIGVTIDTPTLIHGYGGLVAAPVFAEIGANSMRYLGIAPDKEISNKEILKEKLVSKKDSSEPDFEEYPSELIWQDETHFATPNIVGLSLREALVLLSSSNLIIQFTGSGLVHEQSPAPGTPIALGDTLSFSLH